jgi:hypothetical protein
MPAHTKCMDVVSPYILFTKLNYVCEVYQITKKLPFILIGCLSTMSGKSRGTQLLSPAGCRLQVACHWFNQEAAVTRLTYLEHR